MRCGWVCLGLLFAASASAWPVDWVHDVEVGQQKFIRLPRVDWLEVEDPSVVEVVWVESSNELLLSGKSEGRTLVLLGAEGRVAAWRIRVGGRSVEDEKALALARKSCRDFANSPGDGVQLRVTVQSETCRQALLALFECDAFEARNIELTFEGQVLQIQLRALQEKLRKVRGGHAVGAKYAGAGLVLEGTVSLETQRAVYWEILRNNVGRFVLDDKMHIISTGDGGGP